VPELLNRVLVSRQWEEERRERWGVDNPLYQSKVLAEFPDTSDEHVITPTLVRAAQERDLPGTEAGTYGLDVARFGADSSTLYRDRGGVLRMIATWRKQDTHTTRKAVEAAVAQTPEVPIVVDADGLGAAVFDEMRAAGMRVAPFTMTAPVHAKRRFADRRSEMWWSFREEMEEGLIDLDPDDEDLAAQLQQPKWTMDARGRIKVETKEEMGKRGLPSPDKADACIMARFGGPSEMLRSGYRRPGGLRPEGRKMATAGLRDRKM
jgi:phage terminase large subunit